MGYLIIWKNVKEAVGKLNIHDNTYKYTIINNELDEKQFDLYKELYILYCIGDFCGQIICSPVKITNSIISIKSIYETKKSTAKEWDHFKYGILKMNEYKEYGENCYEYLNNIE